MTDQEKINAETQMKLAMQDAKFNIFMQEMNDFKTEIRDRDNQRAQEIRDRDNQRAEDIRDRDNQRAEDIREIRSSIQNLQTNMQNMQNNMQSMQTSNRNLNVVTILGIAAIVVAVLLK